MNPLKFRKVLPWIALGTIAFMVVYRVGFKSIPVAAHTVDIGDIRGEVMGTGTLEARVKTTISPRIQERLAEVFVDQGDVVKRGQVLALLDDAELAQQVAIAEAALAATRATVERVRADEARSQAVLQQARLDHTRLTDLIATKVASQSDFDKAVEFLRVAEADLVRSRAAIVEVQSQVLTAEKNLLYRREQLAFTEIRCPYDGLVIRRDRDPGGIVVPGASILQLIATNEIWVSAWVDETAMAGLKEHQPARVVFRSDAGRNYVGEVARLGREADRETREFLVDVRVGELPGNWTIGQRAEVFIAVGQKAGVLVIPEKYAVWRQGKPGVFVKVQGKARWRDVSLGIHGPAGFEVTQGLVDGEQIVKPPNGRSEPLADGQRITVR